MGEYIVLWLEGPLQSWGHGSQFDVRDTLPFPSWSGICGLLCCALGRGGEQCEFLQKLTTYAPVIYTMEHSCGFSVLRDYQTIGGGYDANDPFEFMMIPKTSDGKRAVGTGSILTVRYALQDYAAAAVLRFDECLASEVAEALIHPRWQLYLGRKAYIPSAPVFLGRFSSEDEAASAIKMHCADRGFSLKQKIIDGSFDADECMTVYDVPLQFGRQKKYRSRVVSIYKLN